MNNNIETGTRVLGRSASEWLLSLPVFLLLLLTLIIGTGEMFHGQLLRLGERFFGDPATNVQYFMLRADPTAPACNPSPDIAAEVAAAMAGSQASSDPLDALFADAPQSPETLRASIAKAAELCREKQLMYEQIKAHLTPAVKAFRTLETSFFAVFRFGTENRSLVLLLITAICAVSTTLGRHHIGIRPPRTQVDMRVHAVAMVIGNALLLFSSWSYIGMQEASGIAMEKPWLAWIWVALFAGLTVISLRQLLSRAPEGTLPGGSIGMALLSIPLYTYMSITSGSYFLLHQHHSAQAIYLNQMMELSGIFLNLALYIWAGMLLKQTRIVDMFLDILRPWKFSPEMLTYLILLAAALPTAYTGASGIFVIAAGAVIYHEVRHAGGSRQFALAATAMSGSLGVVLRPCLLVVLIAALNKEVTTSILYGWGFWVFVLTSTLFLIVAKLTSRDSGRLASPSEAVPGMLRNVRPVIPYMIVVALVILGYKYLLNTKLDEFTAAVIMPVIMLMLVVFDRLRHAPVAPTDRRQLDHAAQTTRTGEDRRGRGTEAGRSRWSHVEVSVRHATNETIGHIGALLMLMALSLGVGGVIERSEVMSLFPHEFGNVWVAMTFLMVTKVLLGMVMDPFGAVILVSSTLAPIAYHNGIDPVHFWMMVLVAFELGYLLPPVALNQLLTRLVVGEKEMDEADAEVSSQPFYRRYERWIMPVIVMTIGMLIVAYGPLMVFGK